MKIKEKMQRDKQKAIEFEASYLEWLELHPNTLTKKDIDDMEESVNNPNFYPYQGA